MLKLEKDLDGYLSFQVRDRFLTKTLVIAFLFALFFHLFALFVFKIKPFSAPEVTWQYPYIQLDSQIFDTSDLSSVTREEIQDSQHMSYNYSTPAPPQPYLSNLSIQKGHQVLFAPIPSPLITLMNENEPIKGIPKIKSKNVPLIHLKGSFTGKTLIAQPTLSSEDFENPPSLAFTGILDEPKGRLIDLVPCQNENENVDGRQIEKYLPILLAKLQFEPKANGTLAAGLIEISWVDSYD